MNIHDAVLIIVGLSVGTIGTLIGAGGGFLLVPFLLMIEHFHSKLAVGVSLAVVFFNALSGTIAYIRKKRVDYRTGFYFLLSSVPGAILGTSLTGLFRGEVFKVIFGGLLLLVVFRMLNGIIFPKGTAVDTSKDEIAVATTAKLTIRKLVDNTGHEYQYSFPMKKGIFLSFFVGIIPVYSV